MTPNEPVSKASPTSPRPHRRPLVALLPAAFAFAAYAATPSPPPPPGPAPDAAKPAAAAPAQAGVPAQPAPEGPQPSAKVVGDATFDFGKVWPGDALKHSFTLTNEGKAELAILKVQPG